jgi:hypothetical protein
MTFDKHYLPDPLALPLDGIPVSEERQNVRLRCLEVAVQSCLGRSVESARDLIVEARLLEAYVTFDPAPPEPERTVIVR